MPMITSTRLSHSTEADDLSERVSADGTPLREIDDVDAAFAEGGVGALERAYEAYGTMVYTMCRRSLGADVAADATQEVFVSAWRNRAQYEPARGSLAGWLTGITRNRIVDVLRSQQRQNVVGTIESDAIASPGVVDDVLDRVLLHDALERLGPPAKRLIELAFFEHLTHAEIAERCALPLGTVKSDIRRGLARLRRHMERGHG
jgi:RNA polymerase sigma factor (sigma-70 family)